MGNEHKVQKDIIDYLKELHDVKGYPIWFDRRQAGGLGYKEGKPDLYAVFCGFHIEIEVKGIGGSPSPRQLAYERDMKDMSTLYIRPGSFKEFVEWFERKVLPIYDIIKKS